MIGAEPRGSSHTITTVLPPLDELTDNTYYLHRMCRIPVGRWLIEQHDWRVCASTIAIQKTKCRKCCTPED